MTLRVFTGMHLRYTLLALVCLLGPACTKRPGNQNNNIPDVPGIPAAIAVAEMLAANTLAVATNASNQDYDVRCIRLSNVVLQGVSPYMNGMYLVSFDATVEYLPGFRQARGLDVQAWNNHGPNFMSWFRLQQYNDMFSPVNHGIVTYPWDANWYAAQQYEKGIRFTGVKVLMRKWTDGWKFAEMAGEAN